MKSSLRFYWLLIMLMLGVNDARAELIAAENFDYSPAGSDLTGQSGGGSFGFSNSWSGQTSYNIGTGSLAAVAAPLPKVGKSVTAVAFGDNRGIDRDLVAPVGTDDTSIYASILIQPQGILGQGAYGGWFGLALRGSTDIVIGLNFGRGKYGLRVADVYADSNLSPQVGVATFLVMRIDFTEGIDPVSLYVNPFPGTPEPLVPSASITDLGINFLSRISLTGPGASGFDALRIGTTYADLTPPVSDFNNDGTVNAADLIEWQLGYGTQGNATNMQGDADGDLDVDGRDFLIWQKQFGSGTSPLAASHSIPEPSALLLAALAAFMQLQRSQRRVTHALPLNTR